MNNPNEPVETMTQGAEIARFVEALWPYATAVEGRGAMVSYSVIEGMAAKFGVAPPAPEAQPEKVEHALNRIADFLTAPAPEVKEEAGELKPLPCPHCGKKGQAIFSGRMWYVDCGGEQCGSHDSEAEAIAAWNRRASAPIPEPSEPQTFEEWLRQYASRFMKRLMTDREFNAWTNMHRSRVEFLSTGFAAGRRSRS